MRQIEIIAIVFRTIELHKYIHVVVNSSSDELLYWYYLQKDRDV